LIQELNEELLSEKGRDLIMLRGGAKEMKVSQMSGCAIWIVVERTSGKKERVLTKLHTGKTSTGT